MKELNIYHTNLRNAGLFFTLSLAIITLSSNENVVKSKNIRVLLNISGIICLIISYQLTMELERFSKEEDSKISNNLLLVIQIMKIMTLSLLIIKGYNLFIHKAK